MQYAVFGLDLNDPQNFRISVTGQKIHESVKCKGAGASDAGFQQSIIGHDIGIIPAVNSPILERNSLRIGEVFALL